MEKTTDFLNLIRFDKQYGTALLLWPTLWSLFIASNGKPSFELLFIFIVGCFLMRSAGCIVNDFADRNIDPYVERTKERPLASGKISVKEALFFFLVIMSICLLLVSFLNTLTIKLSVVAFILAGVYPFVKRISHFPQLVLGMAFGWGAVMAWSAVTGELSIIAFLIFFANVFYSLSYDTIYALMDIEDDRKIKVKSTAIFFGNKVHLIVSAFYVVMFLFLFMVGYLTEGLGTVYLTSILLSLTYFIIMVKQSKQATTREENLHIFISNSHVGFFILLSIIIDLNFI